MSHHSHIPPHLLLPQDMVKVLDTETGDVMICHASDYKHAASVDPKRYRLADAAAEVTQVPPEADTTTNEAPTRHHHHRSHR